MPVILIVASCIALFIILFLAYGYIIFRRKYLSDKPEAFEKEISAYEKRDSAHAQGEGKMLFVGSSVMKYWKTIETDLAPIPVLNRAIAGTKIVQWPYYVDRLVLPYKPSAVALYAGSNDMHGSYAKQPQKILEAFADFEKRVKALLPETKIYFLSILPSPNKARWANWGIIDEANKLIKEYTKTKTDLCFIDATDLFLSGGLPRPELFCSDKVHLNEKGYMVWTEAVRAALGI